MSLAEKDDKSSASAESLGDVLARVHAELEEVARRIDRNQAAIARSTWAAGAADADYVRAMQDADLSAQRIAGVAEFLRALRAASQPHWRIDTAMATDTLKLSELIRSIGTADRAAAPAGASDAGDVDLF
jgi:Ser/Thr protein kinase RdoA (MazF antagonist)